MLETTTQGSHGAIFLPHPVMPGPWSSTAPSMGTHKARRHHPALSNTTGDLAEFPALCATSSKGSSCPLPLLNIAAPRLRWEPAGSCDPGRLCVFNLFPVPPAFSITLQVLFPRWGLYLKQDYSQDTGSHGAVNKQMWESFQHLMVSAMKQKAVLSPTPMGAGMLQLSQHG